MKLLLKPFGIAAHAASAASTIRISEPLSGASRRRNRSIKLSHHTDLRGQRGGAPHDSRNRPSFVNFYIYQLVKSFFCVRF